MDKIAFIYFQVIRKINNKLNIKNSDKTIFLTPIYGIEEGGRLVYDLLMSEEPCLIGRIGSSEMQMLNSCLNVKCGLKKRIPSEKIDIIYTYSGFFPKNEELAWSFFDEYCSAVECADVMAILGNNDEDYMIKEYNKNTKVISLRALEPYYSNSPWTKALEGKKVLVIHPFAETIKEQYKKRKQIFSNIDTLPKFELKTIKAVQTLADNKADFDDWFEALNYMKQQIKETEFDIAIIGCGAYAFPLGAYVKQIGKKAVVLAGATQILFGIKGSRWDNHPVISKLYNENWVRPKESEKPKQFSKIEGGCYW